MVLVIAEGAGQDLLRESMHVVDKKDASGNKQLQDVGFWISQKIKSSFSESLLLLGGYSHNPTYMIRAIPGNASDNGLFNARHAYIPFYRVIERQNKVVITDRMWARLLSSTNQPSFLDAKDVAESKKEKPPSSQLLSDDDGENLHRENHSGKSSYFL
ncbi:unnamed protein product [Coffea canephora]|uniref:Uncharacterized protein n=1 Tax=Coffea canephora TaxID=49390 RepID=A0A068V187_COFCA|nr:unnamed protein product [Coffea canephora]